MHARSSNKVVTNLKLSRHRVDGWHYSKSKYTSNFKVRLSVSMVNKISAVFPIKS